MIRTNKCECKLFAYICTISICKNLHTGYADYKSTQKKASQGPEKKIKIAGDDEDFQHAQKPPGGNQKPLQAGSLRQSGNNHSQKTELSTSKNCSGAAHQRDGSDGLYSRNWPQFAGTLDCDDPRRASAGFAGCEISRCARCS